eukprot:6472008-Prymnesium_polylepis.1
MDYQLQVLAKQTHQTTAAFASFMGSFGVACNTVSLLFSLFGTSFVVRRFGLRAALVIFPLALAAVAFVTALVPDVRLFFWELVIVKGLSYALASPAREMLYVVTSDAIKFKAKSWIDVFGGHAAKAAGSVINNALKFSSAALLVHGSAVSLAFSLALAGVSSWLGRAFELQSVSGRLI